MSYKKTFLRLYIEQYRPKGECDGCGAFGPIVTIFNGGFQYSQCTKCYNSYLETGEVVMAHISRENLLWMQHFSSMEKYQYQHDFTRHLESVETGTMYFGKWSIPYNKREDVSIHPDKAHVYVKNGTYILPKDGSYIRYISNSWYE